VRDQVSHPYSTNGRITVLYREADHSTSSSVEIKNAWSYTSTPPIRFHGVVVS
jgi:hypothetical protein